MAHQNLRRQEAADFLTHEKGYPTSPKTLAKLACTGGGPPFIKYGRFPLYPKDQLIEWAEARRSPLVSTTSELAAQK